MQWPNYSAAKSTRGEVTKSSNLKLSLGRDQDGGLRLHMPKIQAESLGLHTDPKAVGSMSASRSKGAAKREMIGQTMSPTTQWRANVAERKKRSAGETSVDISHASKQQKTVASTVGPTLNAAPDQRQPSSAQVPSRPTPGSGASRPAASPASCGTRDSQDKIFLTCLEDDSLEQMLSAYPTDRRSPGPSHSQQPSHSVTPPSLSAGSGHAAPPSPAHSDISWNLDDL